MIKFKSIVKEATDAYTLNDILHYPTPKVEYKDIYIHTDNIINYRKVEKGDDKNCVAIKFKDCTFQPMTLPNYLVLCRKDDPDAYDKLIK